jgi:geranylgeranyl diphosphate synthase, type II
MLMNHEVQAFYNSLTSDLNRYLSESNRLNEAIKYSLLGDGKRIRPLFCLAFCDAFDGVRAVALKAGSAVEMIHTYSLIHDDLPAMDNDDERRGQPTNHKVYGEAMAILAGDALLNLAPEYLLKELIDSKVDPELCIRFTTSLLKASGHCGMILGQAMDMNTKATDLAAMKFIHQKKTGALIQWSCLAGLFSTLSSEKIQKYESTVLTMGAEFGILFQIIDDLLDAEQDAMIGKISYVSILGLEGARKEAETLIINLEARMNNLSQDWNLLREILESLKIRLA